jgi:hypothetical protein
MKNIIRSECPARDSERSSFDQNQAGIAATCWNFQTPAAAMRGGASSSGKNRRSFRAFRALGQSFFDVEARRGAVVDGTVFGVIGAFSVWPIISAAQALFALIK